MSIFSSFFSEPAWKSMDEAKAVSAVLAVKDVETLQQIMREAPLEKTALAAASLLIGVAKTLKEQGNVDLCRSALAVAVASLDKRSDKKVLFSILKFIKDEGLA
jgi:hypothetical protein